MFCDVVPASVSCHRYFFCFARMPNGFHRNLLEIITTTNRLNYYILGEIETGTREQDMNSNQCRPVLQRCQTGAAA